jgi:hypothetical protein
MNSLAYDGGFAFINFYCQMVTQSIKPSGGNAEEDNQGRNTTGSGNE